MSSNISNNERIAKNTLLLYFRMFLTMIVGLYTSRVILKVLGVDDFGIYSAVGGVVGLLTFLNAALATGSSRFLTYELGKGDNNRLKEMFSTLLSSHILLGFVIILLCETIGLWIVSNKLVIPQERFIPALASYHLSVFTCFLTVVQVPYNAIIISHEKMGVYAYASIVDSVLKLAIVYALYMSPIDILIFYAILMSIVSLCMTLFYRWYCVKNFEESKYNPKLNKTILREVVGYSSWNLLSNLAFTMKNQGAVVLVNMFFNPSVVTAQTIANNVNAMAGQFVDNFRTAANPQIVKRYASGDLQRSKSLLLSSTKYSYYLMLLIGLPIILVAEPLIYVWLGQVPEYSVQFLQVIMVTSIINVFNSSLYTAVLAKGHIKENAISGSILWLIVLPISYVLFKMGFSPIIIAYVTLVSNVLLSLVQKPIILYYIVNYEWNDFKSLFSCCYKVTVATLPIPILCYIYKDDIITNDILQFLFLVFVSTISVLISIWILGIDDVTRSKVCQYVRKRIKR